MAWKKQKLKQAKMKKEICVAGLSFDAEEDDVKAFFKECGEITHVRPGKKKGIAFVGFADAASATKVI